MSKHGTKKMIEVGIKKTPARFKDKPVVSAFRKALDR